MNVGLYLFFSEMLRRRSVDLILCVDLDIDLDYRI